MYRWLVVCLLLSAGAVALVYGITKGQNAIWGQDTPPPSGDQQPPEREAPAPVSGPAASSRSPLPELVEFPAAPRRGLTELVIMHGASLVNFLEQEVSAQKEGIIECIGTDIKPGEIVPPDRQLADVETFFLGVPVDAGYNDPKNPPIVFSQGDKVSRYRRLGDREVPRPKQVEAIPEIHHVRKLKVGDDVLPGQLLALISPVTPLHYELAVKVSVLDGAFNDMMASRKSAEEYERKFRAMQKQETQKPGSVTLDDMYGARMQAQHYFNEAAAKESAIGKAQHELKAALATLRMLEVRAKVPGTIRAIYKHSEGEAIKALEPILQIQNNKRLRVEGLLEIQEAEKLHKGMEVIVEATRQDHPRLVMGDHLNAVTCVAVSKDRKQPIIVSGSEDQTLRGWDARTGVKLWLQGLNSAVRSVACTPPEAKANLVLVGTADGTARLLDLNNIKAGPRELASSHRGAVHAVAFSPDGEVCATGGEDRDIYLWETSSGKQLYRLTDHRGPVTSLQFTSTGKLVSAARDNILLVWDVKPGQPPKRVDPKLDGRGGEVAQLGVSPDGRTVLFDQGKDLRLLSLANKQIEGTLQNPSGELNFSTMALFAPDGNTILTNGPAAGRLQLWRTPDSLGRASEMRQFIWKGGLATCGAFAPDSSFVVTGTQDHQVLVWGMPSKEEAQTPLKGTLVLVDRHLDTRSRQVRVWAEVDNPGWLIPGNSATVVIPPQK